MSGVSTAGGVRIPPQTQTQKDFNPGLEMAYEVRDMNRELCLTGGLLFVLGLVALTQMSAESAVLLAGLGLVFLAVGLGEEAVKELFESFLSIFEEIIDKIFG